MEFACLKLFSISYCDLGSSFNVRYGVSKQNSVQWENHKHIQTFDKNIHLITYNQYLCKIYFDNINIISVNDIDGLNLI